MINCLNKISFKICLGLSAILFFINCSNGELSKIEKEKIKAERQNVISISIEATRTQDIENYMSVLPKDIIIKDNQGGIVTRTRQKANTLRDWSIIKKTLNIKMNIDSIQFAQIDSIIVYTSQSWERLMFQRDGITTDAILTTQKHKEIWKQRQHQWLNYETEELDGEIFINGFPYVQ